MERFLLTLLALQRRQPFRDLRWGALVRILEIQWTYYLASKTLSHYISKCAWWSKIKEDLGGWGNAEERRREKAE